MIYQRLPFTRWLIVLGFTIVMDAAGEMYESVQAFLPGDFNRDGVVDSEDLFILHTHWNANRDDLLILYANWHRGIQVTPSPTFTPTLSATPTPSLTATPSLTPTLSPTPTPTATIPTILTVAIPNLASDARALEMIWIPAGTFLMGSPDREKGRYEDEGPQHLVTISKPFYMGRYEVTNAQFRAFRGNHTSGDYDGLSLDGNNQPAVYISWNDADAFCKWLSDQTGRLIRLPTEAEWEYACRAGSTERYYWGEDPNNNEACRYANIADLSAQLRWSTWTVFNCDDGYAVTAPVGLFQANGFGLYDMLGNTSEWCSDWYSESYYHRSPAMDPQGPDSGTSRVFRGGSWADVPRLVRSAFRNGSTPDFSWDTYGFRVVMPLVP